MSTHQYLVARREPRAQSFFVGVAGAAVLGAWALSAAQKVARVHRAPVPVRRAPNTAPTGPARLLGALGFAILVIAEVRRRYKASENDKKPPAIADSAMAAALDPLALPPTHTADPIH